MSCGVLLTGREAGISHGELKTAEGGTAWRTEGKQENEGKRERHWSMELQRTMGENESAKWHEENVWGASKDEEEEVGERGE